MIKIITAINWIYSMYFFCSVQNIALSRARFSYKTSNCGQSSPPLIYPQYIGMKISMSIFKAKQHVDFPTPLHNDIIKDKDLPFCKTDFCYFFQFWNFFTLQISTSRILQNFHFANEIFHLAKLGFGFVETLKDYVTLTIQIFDGVIKAWMIHDTLVLKWWENVAIAVGTWNFVYNFCLLNFPCFPCYTMISRIFFVFHKIVNRLIHTNSDCHYQCRNDPLSNKFPMLLCSPKQ